MKIYKEIQKSFKQKIIDKIICDICKSETLNEWKTNKNNNIESEIRLEIGHDYYDGGSFGKYEINLCPDCFKDKLIPFVESAGEVKINLEEISY
jgi:hypothetical protein